MLDCKLNVTLDYNIRHIDPRIMRRLHLCLCWYMVAAVTVLPVSPLHSSGLSSIDSAVAVPTYDRETLRRSIVHIGVGGFHRAHLATYVNELCEAGNQDWAIVGCGVMPGDTAMRDALQSQDMLYTLVSRGADSTDTQIIGSIVDYVLAVPDPAAAIAQIANAETQIVSLTITEGGYPIDDLTGEYVADSSNAGPNSAFGIIAAALEQRRTTHGKPITVMSCDNVMSNGHVAETATLGEAQRFGPALLEWISENVRFPNSMVDRITPATADSDRSWLAEKHGIEDQWPVVAEPFRQWVVEDVFAGDRLPLEQLDVIVTTNVEPYEVMKLRLLNASHSCLAYLAALDDIETVDVAMADADIASYVRTFLDHESAPVLPAVQGINIAEYNSTLIERFANPAVGDQIGRLCLDGSAKFPKFLIPTVRANLAQGRGVGLAALALAGWCQYLLGTSQHGTAIDPAPDPKLAEAVEFAKRSVEDPSAFLRFTPVFGEDLAESSVFAEAFTQALLRLRTESVASAIQTAIDEAENSGESTI